MFQRTSDSRHYPFELPSGWVWCRLGEINDIARGGSPRPIKNYITDDPNGVNWIKIGDTTKNSKYIETVKEKIRIEGVRKSRKVFKGDFLLTNSMSFGRPYILKVDGCIHDGWLVISPYGNAYTTDFLYYLLSSNFAYEQFSDVASGGVVTNLNSDKVADTFFPLPPISEQERIVKDIENMFSIIDMIEANSTDLLSLIKYAKNKILDLAIHGKLVPQDPTDEPASELLKRVNPSAEITCDNEQYWNMPNGWCVCRIKDLFKICMGQSPAGTSLNQIEGMEFHQGKICFTDKFLDKSKILTNRPTKIADANSLLICVRAPVGVLNINTRQICIGRGLCALLPSKCVDLGFAFHCLTTYQQRFEQKSTGSTFKAISGDIIKNELFPLPPLAEQQRIVAKIEELFAQLDAIENSLQA